MTGGALKPCLVCGELSPDSRCPEHRIRDTRKRQRPSATRRGYDAKWQRLVSQAIRLQPFCQDCGATEDLQGDHKPEAWRRKAQGLPIRLQDIAIRCGTCNRNAGAARGTHVSRTT